LQEAVELVRRLATVQPDAFQLELGTLLDNLGRCLSDSQRHEAALTATAEAVKIFRRLAAEQPAVFERYLALGLLGFGRVRSEGRLELPQALAATQESITMYRRLAQQRPLPFTEEIRAAQDTVITLLEKVGRTEEATAIRREITQSNPPNAS
jgi:tetratricopeptide (TPR) repeat protein